MIKRIINGLAIGLIVATTILFFYTSKKKVVADPTMYSLLTNYSYLYHNDGKFKVSIFLNDKKNILYYSELNTFFLTNRDNTILMRVYIDKIDVVNQIKYQDVNFYEYELSFFLPSIESDLWIEKAYLNIENEQYTTKVMIGSFNLRYLPNYNYLSFDTIYGSYGMIDEIKNLVGVNLSLNLKKSISIGDVRSGKTICSSLKDYQPTLQENVIAIENIVPNYYESDFEPTILNLYAGKKDLFIPLKITNSFYCSSLYLEFIISGESYFIDNFMYRSNYLELEDYLSLIRKAEIKYVTI